jgi:hypothetical protein
MSTLSESIRLAGYSVEDRYFHEQNQDALESYKKKATLKLIQGGAAKSKDRRESTTGSAPGDCSEMSKAA